MLIISHFKMAYDLKDPSMTLASEPNARMRVSLVVGFVFFILKHFRHSPESALLQLAGLTGCNNVIFLDVYTACHLDAGPFGSGEAKLRLG